MVLTVIGVQAKKDRVYATLAAENSATYENGTFTWTSVPSNGGGQRLKLFSGLKGGSVDLSKYKWLNITISNKSNGAGWRFVIMCNNNANTAAYTSETKGSTLNVRVDLTSLTLNDGSDQALSNVNGIYLQGQWSAGNFDVNSADVYLETDEYEVMNLTTTLDENTEKGTNVVDAVFRYKVYDSSKKTYTDKNYLTTYNTLNTDVTTKSAYYGYVNDMGSSTACWYVGDYSTLKVTAKGNVSNAVRIIFDSTSDMYNMSFDDADNFKEYTYDLAANNKVRLSSFNTENANGTITTRNIKQIDFLKEYLPSSDEEWSFKFDVKSTAVAYDRTFTVGQKSTVCLPFALTEDEVTDAGTFYELKSVDGTKLNFESVTTTEAYKPYMFKAKTASPFASLTGKTIVASSGATTSYPVGSYTFQGTLAHQTVPSGVYGWNSTNGEFLKTNTADVTIDAFRAYITGGAGARLEVSFDDDELTAIQTVKATEAVQDDVMYNLQGQRVGADHKGLVIKNGKKYIIK